MCECVHARPAWNIYGRRPRGNRITWGLLQMTLIKKWNPGHMAHGAGFEPSFLKCSTSARTPRSAAPQHICTAAPSLAPGRGARVQPEGRGLGWEAALPGSPNPAGTLVWAFLLWFPRFLGQRPSAHLRAAALSFPNSEMTYLNFWKRGAARKQTGASPRRQDSNRASPWTTHG